MKKYLLSPLCFLVLVFCTNEAFAQPSVCVIEPFVEVEDEGTEVCVEFTVNDFTDLTSMSFDVYFNNYFLSNTEDKIDFVSATIPPSTLAMLPELDMGDIDLSDIDNSHFRFEWEGLNPNSGHDLPDGTVLFEVCFVTVDDLGYTPIEIVGDRVTRDISGNFNIGYEFIKEGWIQIGESPLVVNIPTVAGLQGDLVCMNFTVDNFTEMLAVQMSIHFDSTALQLESFAGIEPASGGSFTFFENSTGTLTMNWVDADGAGGVSIEDGTSFIQLCFTLIGDCTTLNPVYIDDEPVIREAVTVTSAGIDPDDPPVGILTNPGSVTIDCIEPGAPSLCIPDISDICPGESFTVDVTAQDFDNIRAMDWSVNWNPSVLQLDNVTETTALAGFNLDANAGGGFATCNWQSGFFGSSLADGTTVFTLEFTVVGGGGSNSTISITGSPEEIFFTDQSGPNADHIGYNSCNGFFQACSPTGITVSASDATADPGESVCVDVTVQDFSNITELAFSMDWETSVVSFVEVTNFNLPGLSEANFNLAGANFGVLCLDSWQDAAGVSVPDGSTIFSVCYEAQNNPLACGDFNFSDSPCEEVVMQEGLGFDIGMNSNAGEICLTNPAQFISSISNEGGVTGALVCVDVSVDNFQNLSDMAYSINWNPSLLDFVNLENPNTLNNLNDGSFNITDVDNGNLTINWQAPPNSGETLANGTVIYSVCFQLLQEQGGCIPVEFSDSPLAINVQNANSNNNIGLEANNGEVCLVDALISSANVIGISCNSPDADCDGSIDVTISGGNGDYTYEWTGPSINAGNINNEDQTGLCAGIYTLRTVDTSTGLIRDDVFEVGAGANSPVANAGGDTTLNCGSPLIMLDVSGNGTSEGNNYTYLWQGEGSVSVNPITANSLMPSIAGCNGNVYFSVTDENTNCVVVDTIFVSCATVPTTTAGVDQPFDCNTEILDLDGSNSSEGETLDITWSAENGGTVMQDATNPYLATAMTPGDYILTIFDNSNNCEGTDTLTVVDTRTEPIAEAGMGGIIDCDNESVTLDGTGSDSGAGITYEWTNPNGGPISMDLITTTNETGWHRIIVTDNTNGCTGIDSVLIEMDNQLPTGDAGENVDFFCSTQSVDLAGTGPTDGGNYSYLWAGPGTITNETSLTPTVTEPGTFSLTILNDDTGCDAVYSVVVEDRTTPPLADAGEAMVLNCATPTVSLDGSNSDVGLEYSWMNSDGTMTGIDSGSNGLNPSISAAGTYILTVNDPSTGCSATSEVEVTGSTDAPAAIITDNGAFISCNNETLSLDASQSATGADYEYAWTGPCIDDISNPLAPIISCAGIYQLVVTDTVLNCVSATAEITIMSDLATPIIDTESMISIECGETDVTLDASGSSSGTDFMATWEALDGTINSGENTLTPNVSAGTFGLTIINTVNGCEATAAVVVEASGVTAEAGDNVEIDCGAEVMLDGTGSTTGMMYAWTNAAGTTDGITNPTSLTPTVSVGGVYTLTVTDATGLCTDTDQVEVSTVDFAVSAGDDVPLTCGDDFVTLDGSGSDSEVGTTYLWSTIDGNFVSTDLTMNTVDVDAVGTYTITVTRADGCTDSDEVIVFADAGDLPAAEITNLEHDLCETTAFIAGNMPEGTTGLWTSSSSQVGFAPDAQNATIADNIPGGEILLIWTLSNGNCPNYDADTVLIVTEYTPQAVDDEAEVMMGESELTIDLFENDQTNNVPSFTFSLDDEPSIGTIINNDGDGIITYLPQPGVAGAAVFNYTICNTECPNLCSTATVTIQLDGEIDPDNQPNAITPNQDGFNDVLIFDVLNTGDFPESSLTIFNRWGDEVFTASPYNNDWDGTFNGQPLPQATYYYVLRLDLAEGEVIKGDVTILK